MKKVTALLIAILMVLSMTAIAEEELSPALVTRVGNIVIENTTDGTTDTINLDGFDAFLSIDTTDGLSLIAQAFNGDESLLLAVMKVVGSQLQVAIDGMDKTYTQDIPQLAGQDTSALGETIRPMLPAAMNFTLPMIQIGSLPKVDLTGFAALMGAETAGDTTTFSIPSEIIDMLLDQIVETGKAAAESMPGADQVFAMIEQLRASGISFSLNGQIVDAADQQTATLEFYPVTDGQTAQSAVAVLTLTSAQDALNLKVDIPSDDQPMTIADLQLATENGTFLGTLDIAGMMQFSLTAYQENGMQKAALTMDSMMDASMAVTLEYGNDGTNNVCELTFAAGEEVGLDFILSSVPGEEGVNGSLELTAATAENSVHVTADYETFLGTVDLGDFTMPTDVAPMAEFESEENSEALQNALMPLLEYFAQFVPAQTAA